MRGIKETYGDPQEINMASTLEIWFLFASHVFHAAGTAFLHIPRGVGVM